MSTRIAVCASALLVAACAGGQGLQVGEPRVIVIHLWDPYSLARSLETFLVHQSVRPVIDLRQRLKDPDVAGAWESLEPWEQQLWRDYAARGNARTSSDRTNFHVTDNDRLLMALDLSHAYLPRGAREEGQRLIRDPAFVGGLVSGVGIYILLWVYPEPAFTKGIASIITAALLLQFSVQEIHEFAWAWRTLDQELTHARTIAELDGAAAKFGRSMGARGLHILMIIAGKLAGKALGASPSAVGTRGPPMTAAATGLVLAEGQEIWILHGGMVALAGPGAITVAMSAGGDTGSGRGHGDDTREVDLEAHEKAGGHLLKRHVGQTEAELRARLAAEVDRKEVSTFLSREEAATAISSVLRAQATRVQSWVASGAKDSLTLDGPFNGGMVLVRGATRCAPGAIARVVLRGDGSGGWYIRTSYLLP